MYTLAFRSVCRLFGNATITAYETSTPSRCSMEFGRLPSYWCSQRIMQGLTWGWAGVDVFLSSPAFSSRAGPCSSVITSSRCEDCNRHRSCIDIDSFRGELLLVRIPISAPQSAVGILIARGFPIARSHDKVRVP